MKIKIIALLLIMQSMFAHGVELFNSDEAKKIEINNRILAKVNGKAISVYDVMKKMDMLFYRAFPEYTSSVVYRYQFYQAQWKRVLQDLIDKELIMADAEESKLQVSNGDIRQDMESTFGPNIIANLDKVGLSFDEAWKMVHSEIVIKRMLYIKAQSKALKQVTPQIVRTAYDEHSKEMVVPDTWTYVVITIRDADSEKGKASAQQVYKLLTDEHIALNDLHDNIKTLTPSSKISVSEEMIHTEKEISPAYKEVLGRMTSGSYSEPLAQKSRADNATVYRLFFLKTFREGGIPPFAEISNDLKQRLIEYIAEKEIDAYIKKLRKHFDVQESHLDQVSQDEFEPFHLG